MVTFFTSPKPFRGHFDVIQRNAIQSWLRLQPACQILLCGTEDGAAEVARDYGLEHLPEITRNAHNTPLLNDLFDRAHRAARHEMLCFINCDIVLMNNFLTALGTIPARHQRFLMVGRCWNLEVTERLTFEEPDWATQLQSLIATRGTVRNPKGWAIDYFAFSRNLYTNLPPFAIGRVAYDNWLIWKAVTSKATVIDATDAVTAVHQCHDYSHVPGGRAWSYKGVEAQDNVRLAGKVAVEFMIPDATHRLTPVGMKINWEHYRRRFERWRSRA